MTSMQIRAPAAVPIPGDNSGTPAPVPRQGEPQRHQSHLLQPDQPAAAVPGSGCDQPCFGDSCPQSHTVHAAIQHRGLAAVEIICLSE